MKFDGSRFAIVAHNVLRERQEQDRKWGVQDHPDFDPILMSRPGGCSGDRMARHYNVPTAAHARADCDSQHAIGQGSWADILIEEVAEVVDTCNSPTEHLRDELVQVAAVAVAWIEAIDRRKETNDRV